MILYLNKHIAPVEFGWNCDIIRADKLTPYLEPLNFNPWAQLEFKSKLTGAEIKEKQALEKNNMAVIEKVYQRLREDKEVQGRIRQIKEHSWVRVW